MELGKGKKTKRRRKIYDAQNGRCGYCGIEIEFESTTLDHIVPRSRKGTMALVNLIVCCDPCNQAKRHRNFIEFVTKSGLVPEGDHRAALVARYWEVMRAYGEARNQVRTVGEGLSADGRKTRVEAKDRCA